jgi:hypothetical protein
MLKSLSLSARGEIEVAATRIFYPPSPCPRDNPGAFVLMEEVAMDWNAAIERNREALKRVLAMLVAMAGIAGFTSPLRERMVRLGEAKPRR